MSRAVLFVATALVVPVLSGCSDGDAENARAQHGTVASVRPAWSASDAWRLGEPTTTIRDERLYRVVAAVLLDSTLVVANAGTRQLLFFSAAAEWLHTAGGEGEGPGEYRDLTDLHRYRRDSLLVWDGRLGRASVLASDGRWVRSFPLESTDGHPNPQVVGVFDDGTLVALTNAFRSDVVPGVNIHEGDLVRYSSQGRFLNFVAHSSFATTWRGSEDPFSWPQPLGPGLKYDTRGCELLYGFADTLRVEVVTCDGTPRSRFSVAAARDPVPPSAVQGMRADRLAALRERSSGRAAERAAYRRFLEDVPYPDSLPAFADITVDAAGQVWLTRYPRPWARGDTRQAYVFGPAGDWLGLVDLPSRASLLAVTARSAVLLRRDDLDAEFVEIRPILKPVE